uniref:Replication protein VP4 n=1 Tax=Gokushovirinae environmental samples TaxID=1478972 RepID=A0A2R3UAX4_9VIRU|nr:replication protein VP4 [Gokushovirinae environmental samples]
MACYHPMRAWRTEEGEVSFNRGAIQMRLPCNQCIGCRLRRSGVWAARCVNEAQLHHHNCFLTLTYDDDHLVDKYWTGLLYDQGPNKGEKAYAGNLHYPDIQRFHKRLLRALGRKNTPIVGSADTSAATFRFYLGAEYGPKYGRPHYHTCLFGIEFSDKKYHGKSPAGYKLYRSEQLEKLWRHGYSSIGELNYETAAYTARYVMKKINGQQQKKHYQKIDHNTGEIKTLEPEFNQMSRDQGIGHHWYQQYKTDVYPHDYLVLKNGRKIQPPRYYDNLYKKIHPQQWEQIIADRQERAKQHWQEQKPSRLAVRETIAQAQLKMLKRKI